MPAAELTQTTLTVMGGNEQFVFRIPSPFDQIKHGVRQREIIRRTDPTAAAEMDGLDQTTVFLTRCLATFEVFLVSTTAAWPYSEGPDRKPVIDSSKFPPESITTVMEVAQGFETALDSFFVSRLGDGKPAGTENMESQPDHP